MRRALGLTAAAGLLAGGLVGLAPTSASAAYTTVAEYDGGRVQACRAVVDGGGVVRFRLDNRRAGETHAAGVTRARDGDSRTVVVRAAAGASSSTRTVPVRSGDRLTAFAQEESAGAAQDFTRAALPRC
ncbi:hypothetical protein [uncultured Nocardioides sp.]|uniref:hypothetical protein n=1 Tax=uncultured Nocardioides sp. TaxID=198441 RepID=UPI00263452CF|nr:hypothetical protein [uncultured Nocardioides sp.]